MSTSLKISSYISQKNNWPKCGNYILAQFDDSSIIVYQAYNPAIAKAIIKSQNFHSEECSKSGFSMNRMTWFKTNFLWMMFRSGWASKKDQERILAIRITRKGFEEILAQAVASSHAKNNNSDDNQDHQQHASKSPNKSDEVRLQWDPDHFPNGNKVDGRRAIQLGLRGNMVQRFSREFIIDIEDITDFVLDNKRVLDEQNDSSSEFMIPRELVYTIEDEILIKRINLSI